MYLWIFFLLILSHQSCRWFSLARTPKDDFKKLNTGHARIFLGVFQGDLSLIKLGRDEGGNFHRPLEPFIGELVLRLGKPYINFPFCPPLHMSINLGTKDQLSIASYLIRHHANASDFRIPTNSSYERGYPPAILFGLGLGQYPTSSHAALIQRLYRTFPEEFDLQKLEPWRKETGNSPLLHLVLALKNFDGIYLLIAEFKVNTNEIDVYRITPLHVAAWYGFEQAFVFLLHHKANLFSLDDYGRSPLFLAVIRYQIEIIKLCFSTIFSSPLINNKEAIFYQTLFETDNLGTSIISLLLHPVYQNIGKNIIEYFGTILFEKEYSICSDSKLILLKSIQQKCFDTNILIEEPSQLSKAKNVFLSHFTTQFPISFESNEIIGLGIWAFIDSDQTLFSHYIDHFPIYNFTQIFSNSYLLPLHFNFKIPFSSLEYQLRIPFYDAEMYFPNDFYIPSLHLCGENDQEDYKVLRTNIHSITPLHYHNASYNLLLSGKKKWIFIPPFFVQNSKFMKKINDELIVKYDERLPTNSLDFFDLLFQILISNSIPLYEIIQQPQEIIFIPHDWGHFTFSLENSLSLSQQICSFIHTDARVHPLGWNLYGGYDPHRGLGHLKTHNKTSLPRKNLSLKNKLPVFDFPKVT